MNMQARKRWIASAIAISLSSVSGWSLAASATQDLVDARQEGQIDASYALNPYLRSSELKVAVHSGKATLTGTVEEDVSKDLAKQVALGVSGINEVDNQIQVQPGYVGPIAASKRSFGMVVDDASITTAVKSKLMWSKYTDGMTTSVDTTAGRVVLSGSADTAAARDLAGRLAMNTRGVIAVDNQLKVVAAKPSIGDKAESSAHEAGVGIADSWITTKVKSTLLYSSNVESSDITVSTNSGIVTLSGKLGSGTERALAIELARNVRGVKSVNAKSLTI